ncbi:hypothetical protein NKJ24_12265 [Mesorhizobium sp. M0187]
MGKQHLGMGRVQDDEPFQAVRQLCACRPGDDTAPVMTEEVKPSDAERVGDGNDIADELRERVHGWLSACHWCCSPSGRER